MKVLATLARVRAARAAEALAVAEMMAEIRGQTVRAGTTTAKATTQPAKAKATTKAADTKTVEKAK